MVIYVESVSLNMFSDIDALIADIRSYLTLHPYAQPRLEFSIEGVSEAVLTLESISCSKYGPN